MLKSGGAGSFDIMNVHPYYWKNYPEAALAGILGCRFGGPHDYFGTTFWKPYIGETERCLTTADMKRALRINFWAEVWMVVLVSLVSILC